MAGIRWSAVSSEIASGTSKLTVLQVGAPTNRRLQVDELWLDLKGTTNTDAPVLVEIEIQSDNGTGGDAVTVKKINQSDDETLQTTAVENTDGSSQPTVVAVLIAREVHPQGGMFTWRAPWPGKELPVKGGQKLGISVTAGASVTVQAGILGEE